MKLGVVSDTHGHVGNTLNAVRVLEELGVDTVIHCGDVGSPEIVPLFGNWPTHFVGGNVDYPWDSIGEAIATAGQHDHGEFGSLQHADRKVAFLHSHDAARFQQTIHADWDLVCYGHTHQAKQELQGETIVLNPGALFRARPHSLAWVDLDTMEVQIVEV